MTKSITAYLALFLSVALLHSRAKDSNQRIRQVAMPFAVLMAEAQRLIQASSGRLILMDAVFPRNLPRAIGRGDWN